MIIKTNEHRNNPIGKIGIKLPTVIHGRLDEFVVLFFHF